ncbi:MAG: nucleotide exchange factor GrpE [Anaerolineae bacterium]|nr:nucleotide exchange factor GrpE [Anaerolineae bacterium]
MGVRDDKVREMEQSQAEAEGTAEQVIDEPEDEVTALLQELEESKEKQAEYLDGWQRARAELANARKRFQREQEQAYRNAKADVLVRLLPIMDDLERAFEAIPEDELQTNWIEGMKLVLRKFEMLLKQEGVAPIEAAGQEFDPYYHQAVTHETSGTVPDGHVIEEVQKGYKVDDRVLRPSIVRVSSGPLVEPEADKEGAPGEEPAIEEG